MKLLATLFLWMFFANLSWSQCDQPVDDNDFSQIHAALAGMNEGKEQTIRDITASNCSSSSQIGLFSTLYDQEQSRYDYLLFAKPYVFDAENYASVATNLKDFQLRQQFHAAIAPPAAAAPAPITEPRHIRNPPHAPHHNGLQNQQLEQPQAAMHSPMQGYKGRVGCPFPMDEDRFVQLEQTLKNESFDNKRVALAKQLTAGQCLTVEQLRRLSTHFTFENYKIDFLKEMLNCTHDLDNYLRSDADLTFSGSKKNVSDYFAANVERLTTKKAVVNAEDVKMGQGYTGRRGCDFPISDNDFELLKQVATNESFDNKRTGTLKNALGSRCLSVAQIEELVSLYSFDNYKLEFLKYAYGKTFDLDNFPRIESIFSFESS